MNKIIRKIKLFGIFSILSLLIVSPVNAQQVMDIHDSNAPAIKYIGHQFTLNPRIDLSNQSIDALSMRRMNFTPARNTINSTSILTLFASQATLDNTTDNGAGTQRIDIGKQALTADYTNNSPTNLANITLTALDTGDGGGGTCTSNNGLTNCTSTFTLDYDGGPLQSGAFLGGINHLDSVTPLTVVLQEDDTIPYWANCNPADSTNDVAVNSNVLCDFLDLETGIYLSGTTLNLTDNNGFNNITYANSGGDQYSSSNIINGATLTVNPVENFPYASTITVYGTGEDDGYNNGPVLDRNTGTFITAGLADPYTFNTEDDVDAPEIYSLNPADTQTGVGITTNIDFNIRDVHSTGGYAGLGVDISTLQVTVSAPGWGPEVYTTISPELTANVLDTNTPYNNPYDYSISINPATDFPQNIWVTVQVVADDLHVPGNSLATSYSFMTADTTPPTCLNFVPTQNSTAMLAGDDISFECTDDGMGVDIDSVSIILDSVEYTRGGPNTFSYTGDSSDYVITIDPVADFASAYAFEVIINLEDLSNNAINQISYGLAPGTGSTSTGGGGGGGTRTIYITETETIEVPVIETEEIIKDRYNLIEVPFHSTRAEMGSVNLVSVNSKQIDLKIIHINENDDEIVFEGTANPNAYVTLLIESDPIILTTVADENGNWRMSLKNILVGNEHKIYSISRNASTDQIEDKTWLSDLVIEKNIVGLSRLVKEKDSLSLWLLCLIPLVILVLAVVLYKHKRKHDDKKSK